MPPGRYHRRLPKNVGTPESAFYARGPDYSKHLLFASAAANILSRTGFYSFGEIPYTVLNDITRFKLV